MALTYTETLSKLESRVLRTLERELAALETLAKQQQLDGKASTRLARAAQLLLRLRREHTDHLKRAAQQRTGVASVDAVRDLCASSEFRRLVSAELARYADGGP